VIIGIFVHVRYRLFAFGCGVLLVIYWLNQINQRSRHAIRISLSA
jgi:hypothetical protein